MPISQIVTNSIASGAVGATQTASANQFYSFKNRIINGAGTINQRNTSASAQALSNGYSVLPDRFYWRSSNSFTYQPSSDTPPGFSTSMQLNATSIFSGGAFFGQIIEGFNVADFNLGTANASSFSLSFWVKCSRAGNYGVLIGNGNTSLSSMTALYATTYTITSANTWQRISITVPSATSGTWNTTNSIGLNVTFTLIETFTGTSIVNTWDYSPFPYESIIGQTSLQDGDVIRFAGIQVEKGSTATSFDYRPYGTELALCQRYFQSFASEQFTIQCSSYFSGTVSWGGQLMQEMRASPTISITRLAAKNLVNSPFETAITGASVFANTKSYGGYGSLSGISPGQAYNTAINYTASAEL